MKMKQFGWVAIAAASMVLLSNGAFARAPHRHPATISQRLARQHARILHGLRSKKMTYQQGTRLEQRDTNILRQTDRYRQQHHRKLTPTEYRKITGELNRNSRRIWHAKHH